MSESFAPDLPTGSIFDLELTVTHFHSYKDQRPSQRKLTVNELKELIASQRADTKERLPLFGFYELHEYRCDGISPRRNDNVAAITALAIDYDAGRIGFDEAVAMLRAHGIGCIVYTTPSYTPDKPRWRIIAILSRPHSPGAHQMLVDYINRLIGNIAARESYTLSQMYHYGALVAAEEMFRYEVLEGATVDTLFDQEASGGNLGRAQPTATLSYSATLGTEARRLEAYARDQVDWPQVYRASASLTELERERPDLFRRLQSDLELVPKLKHRWEGGSQGLTDRSRSGRDRSLALILRALDYNITDTLTIVAAWGQTFPVWGAGLSSVDKQGRNVDRERQLVRLWIGQDDRVPVRADDLPVASASEVLEAEAAGLEFPVEQFPMPPILKELVEFLDRASPTRVPYGLLVAAALTAIAFFAQNRFVAGSDRFSTPVQVYCLLVARTGVGKTRLAKLIVRLVKGTRLQTKVVDELASGAALLKKMEQSVEESPWGPTLFFFLDEAGLKLKRRFEKNGTGHVADLINATMELFGKGDGSFNGKSYADTRLEIKPIERPNLNLIAFTTKAALVDALGQADAHTGLINRMLLATVPDEVAEQKQFGELDEAVPENLLRFVRGLANGDLKVVGDHPSTWVSGEGPTACIAEAYKNVLGLQPQVYLHYSEDAEEYLRELTTEANQLINDPHELFAALSPRFRQNVIAVAAVLAICELNLGNPTAPLITSRHLKAAREFVLWSHRNWCSLFSRNVAANAEQAAVNDLLDLIGRAHDFAPGGPRRANFGTSQHLDAICARGWMPHALVGKELPSIPRDLRAKAIATLLENEQIIMEEIEPFGGKGRKGRAYRLN